LANIHEFNANWLNHLLLKGELELSGRTMLFKIAISLNAVDANLPGSLPTVIACHGVRIITIVVLTFLNEGLTKGTLVLVPCSKHS